MTEPARPLTLSIDAAAARIGVSRRTIYNYIKIGCVTTVRTLNGSLRVTESSLAALPPRGRKCVEPTDEDIP